MYIYTYIFKKAGSDWVHWGPEVVHFLHTLRTAKAADPRTTPRRAGCGDIAQRGDDRGDEWPQVLRVALWDLLSALPTGPILLSTPICSK